MANRTTRTPEKEAAFLEALGAGLSVSGACQKAAIPRRTAYDWRDASEEFRIAWQEAIEQGTDGLEDEGLRRAVTGVERPVFQGGKQVGSVKDYSDTLLIFLLKARRPEKYKDRFSGELTGKDGGPLRPQPSPIELAKAVALLLSRGLDDADEEGADAATSETSINAIKESRNG